MYEEHDGDGCVAIAAAVSRPQRAWTRAPELTATGRSSAAFETGRLPVVLVVDRSGSMIGSKAETLGDGLRHLLASVGEHPEVGVGLDLAMVTFGDDVRVAVPVGPAREADGPRLGSEAGPRLQQQSR